MRNHTSYKGTRVLDGEQNQPKKKHQPGIRAKGLWTKRWGAAAAEAAAVNARRTCSHTLSTIFFAFFSFFNNT